MVIFSINYKYYLLPKRIFYLKVKLLKEKNFFRGCKTKNNIYTYDQ